MAVHFCKARLEYNNEAEMVWQTQIPYTEEIGQIKRLSKTITDGAKADGGFMIYGIGLNVVIVENGQNRNHNFIMSRPDTDELQLIRCS